MVGVNLAGKRVGEECGGYEWQLRRSRRRERREGIRGAFFGGVRKKKKSKSSGRIDGYVDGAEEDGLFSHTQGE